MIGGADMPGEDELGEAILDAARADSADGWVVRYHRATDTLTFGPFETVADAVAWMHDHNIAGVLVACYRTVDWNRRGV